MTWNEAKAALAAAGLGYAFERGIDEVLATSAPDDATVSRATPAPGQSVRRGDTVVVRLSAD